MRVPPGVMLASLGQIQGLIAKTVTSNTPTRVYYYHNDHLGTPQVMTDEGGQVVWRADYRPFGEATVTTSEIENEFRFPGQYRDEETGLHQNWFREYAAGIGRYLEADPIGLLGGVNLYAYAGNDPINWRDPFGLFWEYAQSSGRLTYVDNQTGARTPVAVGYSGYGPGLNNPAMQDVRNVGPIPQGVYDIGPAYRHQKLGPVTMDLNPRPGTNTFDRDALRMHSDNPNQDYSASHGCIVQPRNAREKISKSHDRELRVVP